MEAVDLTEPVPSRFTIELFTAVFSALYPSSKSASNPEPPPSTAFIAVSN